MHPAPEGFPVYIGVLKQTDKLYLLFVKWGGGSSIVGTRFESRQAISKALRIYRSERRLGNVRWDRSYKIWQWEVFIKVSHLHPVKP